APRLVAVVVFFIGHIPFVVITGDVAAGGRSPSLGEMSGRFLTARSTARRSTRQPVPRGATQETRRGPPPTGSGPLRVVPDGSLGGGLADGDRGGLLEEVLGARGIDEDARAHGRAQHGLGDVASLGRRGLEAEDLLDRRLVVLHERLLVEARYPDDE